MSQLESLLESIQLPSINEVAHELIQSLNQDAVSVLDVRNIIAKDPALSAHLLRLANSAQFGLPRGVGTLDDAITMVGMGRVRVLALGASLAEAFPAMPGLDRRAFWQSTMACAGYSLWLANRLGIDGQVAWLTGMVLRLGELLIEQVPHAAADVATATEPGPRDAIQRWQRQVAVWGFTEGHAAAELARRWNFPMQMVQGLERSSAPLLEQAFSRLGSVLHLAALLAESDRTGPEAILALPPEVIDSLKLDLDWLQETLPDQSTFVDISAT